MQRWGLVSELFLTNSFRKNVQIFRIKSEIPKTRSSLVQSSATWKSSWKKKLNQPCIILPGQLITSLRQHAGIVPLDPHPFQPNWPTFHRKLGYTQLFAKQYNYWRIKSTSVKIQVKIRVMHAYDLFHLKKNQLVYVDSHMSLLLKRFVWTRPFRL